MKFKNFLSKEIFVCIITQPAFISSLVFFSMWKIWQVLWISNLRPFKINLLISVISYQSKSAKTVLDTILEIQPKDSSGGGSGETRESIVYRICDDMLEKLPNDYVPFEVKARLEKMGRLQPMNIFLKQEIDRMQLVISLVRSTLSDLKLAIDGTIIMSESLRDALDCMYDARIPKLWQKVITNISYLCNLKTKSIILKLDFCISIKFLN